jgi:hypothetical protein
MTYKDRIGIVLDREIAGGRLACRYDPRHIEAWMREGHPTLDGLSAKQFDNEVLIAIKCIKSAGPKMSEALAQSYAL